MKNSEHAFSTRRPVEGIFNTRPTNSRWFNPATSWEDMESRLEALEKKEASKLSTKLRLSSRCAIQQLRKIIRQLKPGRI